MITLGQSEDDPGTFWGRMWVSVGDSVRGATGIVGTTIRDVLMSDYDKATSSAADPGSGSAGIEASPAGASTSRRSGTGGVVATEVGGSSDYEASASPALWPWLLGVGLLAGGAALVIRATEKRQRRQ